MIDLKLLRDDLDFVRGAYARRGGVSQLDEVAELDRKHRRMLAEVENVRAALDWARASGETELEIRILFALENWFTTAGPTRQSLERAETLLGRLDGVPHRLQADLLRVLGNATVACHHV